MRSMTHASSLWVAPGLQAASRGCDPDGNAAALGPVRDLPATGAATAGCAAWTCSRGMLSLRVCASESKCDTDLWQRGICMLECACCNNLYQEQAQVEKETLRLISTMRYHTAALSVRVGGRACTAHCVPLRTRASCCAPCECTCVEARAPTAWQRLRKSRQETGRRTWCMGSVSTWQGH